MHHIIETMVTLVAAVIGLGVVSRGFRLPLPILLVLGGLALSQMDVPVLLDPDLILMGFMPPLLYAAAFQTNWPDFRRAFRSIMSLAIGLTLFTAAMVAWAAHDLIGMPWAASFVLGAIVSPPDAVAAVAVTRLVRVPREIITLLEGESLVNDASALVALRIAAASAAGAAFEVDRALVEFVAVSVGGTAIGLAGAWLAVRLHEWLRRTGLGEPKLHIAISLVSPYLVYLPAERMGVSGVLAVVAAGLYIGRYGLKALRRQWCAEARAVWDMVEFLLTGLIFVLIGFQLPVVMSALGSRRTPGDVFRAAVVVCGVVIGSRLLWMFPRAYIPVWIDRIARGRNTRHPSWRSVVVVGWTGMRGVVSLAAAMALPIDGANGPFPNRDLILFLTFTVILVTLIGQGLTLPILIRWLGVSRLVEQQDVTLVVQDVVEPPTAAGGDLEPA